VPDDFDLDVRVGDPLASLVQGGPPNTPPTIGTVWLPTSEPTRIGYDPRLGTGHKTGQPTAASFDRPTTWTPPNTPSAHHPMIAR